jgi:predicted phage terminase large subunit-like protein
MTVAMRPEAAVAWAEDECARQSLGDYAQQVSADTYEQPAHVKVLIEHLEAVERREIRRLMVNMPPRGSKSMHCSRLLPSWWLGRHPSDGVILASYGDTLAVDNGRSVRDLLMHRRYPFATAMRADAKAAGRWYTNQGGGLVAVGRGAGITGWMLPGNLLVPDDLIKDRQEAESEVIRESAWTWWQEVFMTRLARDGAVVFPSTRWHEDDVSGRILNSPGAADWTVLSFPYLAEPGDPLGRAVGDPLTTYGYVPSVEAGEISAYGFSALYQQRPTPAGGGVFKAEWMQRRYCVGHGGASCPKAAAPLAESYPRWRTAQTVDIGGKQGVGHDPSAIATWGYDGISLYVLDYWSSQAEYADVKPKVAAKWHEWRGFKGGRPHLVHIEDATWAQPLISDLNRETGVLVAAVTPWGSKWVRADAAAPVFQAGRVVLPCQAPWLDGWIHEHLSFPNALHDEAVDTTSMAVRELREVGATMPRKSMSGTPLATSAV